MKIGIDISQIVYQTGVSRYTAQLVESLLKFDKVNDYVLFGGSLRQQSILRAFSAKLPRKVKLVLSPLSPKLADIYFNRFNGSIDPLIGPVDVFHASNWSIPRTKAALVTTVHDLTFINNPENHLAYYIGAHQRHLNRAKSKVVALIAVSQATKRDLLAQGWETDRVKVIYEAAAAVFKPANVRRQPIILCVGTLEPRKNIKRVVEAFKLLKLPKHELVIVGKFGWGETARPVERIKLLGYVPDEELAELYCRAAVFVYPSLGEGFGLPVVEALSCGCPVVTSDRSSLPEVGGQAAVYVNPESVTSIARGIETALSHPGPAAARLNQASQFSWEKTARETLKVYQEVYAHRG